MLKEYQTLCSALLRKIQVKFIIFNDIFAILNPINHSQCCGFGVYFISHNYVSWSVLTSQYENLVSLIIGVFAVKDLVSSAQKALIV